MPHSPQMHPFGVAYLRKCRHVNFLAVRPPPIGEHACSTVGAERYVGPVGELVDPPVWPSARPDQEGLAVWLQAANPDSITQTALA